MSKKYEAPFLSGCIANACLPHTHTHVQLDLIIHNTHLPTSHMRVQLDLVAHSHTSAYLTHACAADLIIHSTHLPTPHMHVQLDLVINVRQAFNSRLSLQHQKIITLSTPKIFLKKVETRIAF